VEAEAVEAVEEDEAVAEVEAEAEEGKVNA
jgi:hypothetical protein